MEALKTFTKGKYILEIFHDEMPDNPRYHNDITKLILFHRRYNLGDSHGYNQRDYSNWGQMEADIIEREKPGVILPVYMYEHSGVVLSTSSFNDRWDSGQIGFVTIDWKTAQGMKIEQAVTLIEEQLRDYTAYLNGDVYLYKISELLTCNLGCQHKQYVTDAFCYYDMDHCYSDGIEQLESYLDSEVPA